MQGAWRCANPNCARRGRVRRQRWRDLPLCGRCGQAAARTAGGLWGGGAVAMLCRAAPAARLALCLLRDAGLLRARM